MAPPGQWRVWALITGRGWGKTRTETEWLHERARESPGAAGFIAGRTLGDVTRTLIHHPTSGLLATSKPDNPCRLRHREGQAVIEWANGAFADVHTSEEPDRARGPEYAFGVADEVATWKRVVDFEGNTTWDNLQLALRAGAHPQMVAGTTPRRRSSVVEYLIESAESERRDVVLTRGSMLENRENLAASAVDYYLDTYGGTRLERQEIHGELLPEVEGALVTSDLIETSRRAHGEVPEMLRVVVGVDPSGGQAEVGIVTAGLGSDGHYYVRADRSGKMKPLRWARRTLEALGLHGGDCVAAERNFGGDMVESNLRTVDEDAPVKMVTASRGKHVRFEPVGSLYQQGRVHHVGSHPQLEDEVVCFTEGGYEGEGSPNRADALVWAITELRGGKQALPPTW